MKASKHRELKKKRFIDNRALKELEKKKHKKKKPSTFNRIEYINKKAFLPHNILIDFLKEKNFKTISEIPEDGIAQIKIPKVFSFSENPEETIEIMKEIVFYGTNDKIVGMKFDHRDCNVLGMCASTVMDAILIEIRSSRKMFGRKFELGGKLPIDEDLRDMLSFSGILKHVGFEEPKKDNVKKLDLIKNGESDYVSTQVTDYYINCLRTQKFTLTKTGRQKISEMVGEIINNCKLHGGSKSQWYTLGHYFIRNKKEFGECHLVIINFGQTIYESLKSPETTKQILTSLRKMTKRHVGFFSGGKWTEESLWTLYALQDGVSRFRDKHKDPDRGTGTIKLIDGFQKVGNTMDGEKPTMSITSGRINILFNGDYQLQYKQYGSESRKVIAFNEENDLYVPPDERNVRILNNYFPGTVIAMKFYLDRNYLKEIVKGDKNGN